MFLVIGLFSGKGGEDVGKILQHARKAGDVGLARSGKAEQEKHLQEKVMCLNIVY